MWKIIPFSSLAWAEEDWKKLTTWGDPQTNQWRGSPIDQDGREIPTAREDPHIMFVLRSLSSPSKMTYVSIDADREPEQLKMGRGGEVLIGTDFIYYDDRLEIKPTNPFFNKFYQPEGNRTNLKNS